MVSLVVCSLVVTDAEYDTILYVYSLARVVISSPSLPWFALVLPVPVFIPLLASYPLYPHPPPLFLPPYPHVMFIFPPAASVRTSPFIRCATHPPLCLVVADNGAPPSLTLSHLRPGLSPCYYTYLRHT